jgi:hypothetical protein
VHQVIDAVVVKGPWQEQGGGFGGFAEVKNGVRGAHTIWVCRVSTTRKSTGPDAMKNRRNQLLRHLLERM